MARKKKPVDQAFNTVEMKDGAAVASQTPENATVLEKIENKTGGTVEIRDEIKQKLEAFEKMEKAVAELSAENSALKDKMAEYVEEITALREQVKTPKVVEKEVIKEVVKEVPVAGDSGEIEKLKKELASLQEENDKYLMRISELTFDNAKMTAKMNNTAKKLPPPAPPAGQRFRNVYRNSGKLNGYSSWN
jgi:predicted RNase H-like nuclease (RuvC/YqgF family)